MMKINKPDIANIIKNHKNLIYKIVNSYFTDSNEQEDVIQEIIFQTIKSYKNFDHKVKVTTWLYRVAFNITISNYRTQKTRKKHVVEMPSKIVAIDEDVTNEYDERIKQLRVFIQEFDPLNKAIVIMYLDGNSHKEISEAMGISLSNVGTKISRIKTQLKKKFKQ
ncbi:RNA polymerase sigma factor [Tenacibaculum soleae]|uniref:RNA polymerase sigma factor n=1 Tax=Tenacibaculum soleae TaxID=447689 RepID=UPI003AB49556